MAKISVQWNNELACNDTIIIWQRVVTQKVVILFDENIYCFISVIGSAITTTILKREVFNVITINTTHYKNASLD